MRARTWTRFVGAILVALGLGLYFFSREPTGQETSGARLLPDVGGSLELVVGHVTSARRAALRNASLATEIVNGLSSATEILLTATDPEAFTVASNPWPERVRLVPLERDRDFSIWPQDPFLVLEDGDGSHVLLVSQEFQRADDQDFAKLLAASIDWPMRRSELTFEGGNIVSDVETIFVGANTIRQNAATLGETENEIAHRFELELGRPVLVVGPYPQPIGHIDMMLTPLGGRRLLLADPRAGATLATAAADEEIESFERLCEDSFFGHPSIRALTDREGNVVEAPEIEGRTTEAIAYSLTLAPVLDELAHLLESRGYLVERVPALFGKPADASDGPPGPSYPALTYNNVLIEETRVYLPQYGLTTLDDAGRATWERLGFEIHAIEGFAVSAMYGGALRCCIKVLARR